MSRRQRNFTPRRLQHWQLLTGVDPISVPDCPISLVTASTKDTQAYIDSAKTNRPEVKRLMAAKRATKANVKINKGGFYPDLLLALQAGYSYTPGVTDIQNPFISDSANRRKLGAALVARWSLDLAGQANRIKRSKAQSAELEAKTEEAMTGIELEVRRSIEALLDAKRRQIAWNKGERETRKWFIAAAQGHQVGTTEPKELVDAIKNYFTARYQRLQATADHNIAVANLERVSGMMLAEPGAWRSQCAE